MSTPAIARFKDLSVDAVDNRLLGTFWARVLGRELSEHEDGMVQLTGPTPQHTIWLDAVPEPVTVKQRVHLDVHAGSVDEVLELGATFDDDSHRWTVVRDPEGGELCVFVRETVPGDRLYEIVVDCADPQPLAAWWAEVLGGVTGYDEEKAFSWVEQIPGAPFEGLVFVPVPEAKTVKNRIHWDVETADVALLSAAGATVLRAPDDEIGWTVLADPEGNEFCAFT